MKRVNGALLYGLFMATLILLLNLSLSNGLNVDIEVLFLFDIVALLFAIWYFIVLGIGNHDRN